MDQGGFVWRKDWGVKISLNYHFKEILQTFTQGPRLISAAKKLVVKISWNYHFKEILQTFTQGPRLISAAKKLRGEKSPGTIPLKKFYKPLLRGQDWLVRQKNWGVKISPRTVHF